MIKFSQLGELPFSLERLDEGNGIEMTMINNEAQYHQLCRLKYNNTKLRRAEKRVESEKYSTNVGCTHTRSKCNESSSSSSNLIQNSQAVKKECGPEKGYGEKRCEIQGGGQEMAVMVG